MKHAGPRRKLSFTLSNTGEAELIVRAVEGEGHIATTLAPGQTVAPGGSYRAEVLLDPGTQDFGVLTEHLVVVTNRSRAADAAAADHGDHRRVTHKRLIRHNVPHS